MYLETLNSLISNLRYSWKLLLGLTGTMSVVAGCVSLETYYEANFEGDVPRVVKACHGLNSAAKLYKDGIGVSLAAYKDSDTLTNVRIQYSLEKDVSLLFSSNIVTVVSPELNKPSTYQFIRFTQAYNTAVVRVPSWAQIIRNPVTPFEANLKLPGLLKSFDVKIPDVSLNGSRVSFPLVHFRVGSQINMDLCEA